MAGEFAIIPPLLGSSQLLLNREHHSVYYKVSCQNDSLPFVTRQCEREVVSQGDMVLQGMSAFAVM